VAPAVIHLNQDQKGDDCNHTANTIHNLASIRICWIYMEHA
jgi:hypothetical protein